MERIPWISHHPLDVKRGTFSGELSRLATISSTLPVYVEAAKDLVSLYVHRGYPQDIVSTWAKRYVKPRWENRLSDNSERALEGVLVLKSEYNPIWNYFNAKELGDTIFNYWNAWYEKAERGSYVNTNNIDNYYPAPDKPLPGSFAVLPDLLTRVQGRDGQPVEVADLRKIQLIGNRVLVSKKRTKNLFDLTSLWKRIVFQKLDEKALEQPRKTGLLPQEPSLTGTFMDPDPDAWLNYRLENQDNIHRRSSPERDVTDPAYLLD
ncbi:hypothetical protein TRAPUB_5352 [Trametes pubescens]|uniref:Uncharacterized protein n=1 Tax=Trametes pubescens TaxID=154538 RepID=A0A1M2V8V4_TRAPU|nr:hypothetical protein TRAPUB_5352 [Trametes pubescens]